MRDAMPPHLIPATDIFPNNRFAPHAAYERVGGGWVMWHRLTEKDAHGQTVTMWRRSKITISEEVEGVKQ